jgi:undecaprenyl-diphosphatase
MRVVVNDYFIPVILSLALLGLWFEGESVIQREHHQRGVLCAAISLGITCGIVKLFNLFYFRPRPFQDMPNLVGAANNIFYLPHDSSFPSNAAAVVFAIATAVWLSNRKIGAFLYFLAFLMPFARVYAAVHYPLDVVGGAAIGILSSYFVFKVFLPLIEPGPTLLLKLLRKLYLA